MVDLNDALVESGSLVQLYNNEMQSDASVITNKFSYIISNFEQTILNKPMRVPLRVIH
jgi:hypothetical protein